MTLAFVALPTSERKIYVDEAAARRGLAPVIVEKDFWVCWLLSILFESSFRDGIVFKGGTSLSKVFGVINRFSEDIDLSLAPALLGLDEPDASSALSKGQAGKWMGRAEEACVTVVRDQLVPELSAVIEQHLGAAPDPWLTFEVDTTSHSPVVLFHYPTTQPPALEYLKRSVKLEFGSLTGTAMSWLSTCIELFGRRRRFSTRSTIGLRTRPRRIDSPATIPTRQRSRFTQRPLLP